MTPEEILDIAGASLVLLGSAFCLVAAVGLLRLPDVLSRMHAASKPQSFGVLLLCVGLALVLRDGGAAAMLALAASLMLITAPVAAHMMAKAAYRTGQYRKDLVEHEEGTDSPDAG